MYSSVVRYTLLIAAVILASCTQANTESEDSQAQTSADQPLTKTVENAPSKPAVNSIYCFERVGQIQAEPRRGDVCDAYGLGAAGFTAAQGSPTRNTASFHIESPSLKAAGIKAASFNLNRGGGRPKFSTGVHVMDQATLLRIPQGGSLPDRVVFVNDAEGQESMFSYTVPDAAFLRANGGGIDWAGFEIASAVLTIQSAVDVPLDEFEEKYLNGAGMVMGRQYIEGTFSLSLIPMGSKGAQYGPTTFEFGEMIDWGLPKENK